MGRRAPARPGAAAPGFFTILTRWGIVNGDWRRDMCQRLFHPLAPAIRHTLFTSRYATMKHLLTICLMLGLVTGAAHAQDAEPDTTTDVQPLAYLGDLPPLIDRELFFGDPEISGAQISPDGRYITFLKPYRDARNVFIKGIDEPFDAARPLTADDRPIPGYFWSQDGRYVLYVQDKGGNENFHVYAVDPAAEPTDSTDVPPARDLTPLDDVRANIYAVPENAPGEILVGLNDRDPAYHDVYRLDLETGERELLFENTENVAAWQADLEGDLRLGVRVAEDGSTEVLRVDGDALTSVYACTVEETCAPVRFHEDGERVYMQTNQGDPDLTRLVLFNPETGDETVVESDPEDEVDFGGAVFSDATDELVATYYVGDRLRYYPKDTTFARDLEILREQLPEGEIYFGSSTNDGRLQLVSVVRDVDSGRDLPLPPRDGRGRAPLPLPPRAPQRRPGRDAGGPLHGPRRARDPGLPHLAEGGRGRRARRRHQPARRAVGARHLGLRRLRAVFSEPGLRRAPAELPRLDGLRRGVPQRGERRVGHGRDAARPHRRRPLPHRGGDRRL